MGGKDRGLLGVTFRHLLLRAHLRGDVAVRERRQGTGDQHVAARGFARPVGQFAGLQVHLLVALLDADLGHEGAHHAIGVGRDDIGAGLDELAMQALDQVGPLDQGATRPEGRAGLAQAGLGNRLAHAAVEQQGAVGGQVEGRHGDGVLLRRCLGAGGWRAIDGGERAD